jgi:hypothetical protein
VRAVTGEPPGVPGFRQRIPGGRLRVERVGLVWRDEAAGEHEVVLPAAQVAALRLATDPAPQLVVVLARPPGVPADTISLGSLEELRLTRDDVLLQAHAAGVTVEDPPSRVATGLLAAQDDEPVVVRDRVGLRLRVVGCLSVPVLLVAGLVTWRVSVAVDPVVPPLLVVGVALVCWALMALLVSRPDVLTVTRDEVRSRAGYDRNAWSVRRADVSAVAWLRDDSRALVLLVFYDHGGVPVRQAPIPQDQEAVAAALVARGWPLRGPTTAV